MHIIAKIEMWEAYAFLNSYPDQLPAQAGTIHVIKDQQMVAVKSIEQDRFQADSTLDDTKFFSVVTKEDEVLHYPSHSPAFVIGEHP